MGKAEAALERLAQEELEDKRVSAMLPSLLYAEDWSVSGRERAVVRYTQRLEAEVRNLRLRLDRP